MFSRLTWLLAVVLLSCSAPALATAPIPTATELMNWAETAYPEHFPGRQIDRSAPPYIYRHYPGTGNYLGVAGNEVYVLGPVAGSSLLPVRVGLLADFACPVTPGACGTKTVHRLTIDGLVREYIVYLSWKAQQPGAAKSPVVFMLHGTSGDGERFFNISGWREKADAEGLIAVFPSALSHCFYEDENRDGVYAANERKLTTKWSSGALGVADGLPLCAAAEVAQLPAAQRALVDHPQADDMAFFAQMLDALAATYPADMKRVYASGFSNGGAMTSRLAAQMSTRFAAIATAAGVLGVPALPAQRPLSVTFSVGASDPGLAASFGYATLPLDASLGSASGFVNRLITPWTTVLQLAPSFSWSKATPFGTTLSRFTYTTSIVGAGNRFNAVIIDGADHLYPNGSNHPFKMAELLWEFFKSESLP